MNKDEQLMAGFWNIFNKKIWLESIKLKASLSGYTPSEIHCLEYIGASIDSNVTEIAESFFMTKSAISKLTKRLIKKGLIENYQKPDNKKEVCFRLSEQGKLVNKIHKDLDKEFQKRDKTVFEQVSEEQYEIMIRFAESYNTHLDMEIKKQDLFGPDKM